MKTIIAGSRSITDPYLIARVIANLNLNISMVISGGAKGADSLGEVYAEIRGIPLIIVPANWKYYGKSAGCIRNETMLALADVVVVLWDGVSKGAKHMYDITKKSGKLGYLLTRQGESHR